MLHVKNPKSPARPFFQTSDSVNGLRKKNKLLRKKSWIFTILINTGIIPPGCTFKIDLEPLFRCR